MEDFDELDRAIFALPLSMPPPGLRQSILRSTIYALPEPAVTFAMREIVAIGAALAIAAWIVVYAVFEPKLVLSLSANMGALARSFAQAQTLAWLAAGAAVAVVATVVQDIPLPRRSHRGRA